MIDVDARKRLQRVHEGGYVAEVEVVVSGFDEAWGPYLSPDDVRKLDAARLALRNGDVKEALKYGKVYRLTPVTAA
jgi:hypothetical protein